MNKRSLPRPCRSRRFLPVGLAIALLAAHAAAQQVEIYGKPGGPFSGYAVSEAWSQRKVTLRNDTSRERALKTGCESAADANNPAVLYSRVVTVPPGALREAVFAYRPGRMRPTGQKIDGREQTTLTYRLWDQVDDRQAAPVQFDASIAPVRHTNVGVMFAYGQDPETSYDQFLFLENLRQQELQDVTLMIHSLRIDQRPPSQWYGYDGLDVLITGRLNYARLIPAERTALLDWVGRGGVAVMVAGEGMGGWLNNDMARAAGVEVLGEHRTSSLAVTGPKGGEVPPVSLRWPAVFAELAPTGAEVLYTANGLPLLTRHRWGQGWVFVLAVPLGAVEAPSLHQIWKPVNYARKTYGALQPDRFHEAGRRTLREIAGIRAPGRLWPALLLVALAVGTVIAGVALRRRGRGEWAWIVLVPLCIVLAGVFFAVSRLRDDPQRLSYVGLLTQQPGGRSRVQQLFAYYSGTEERQGLTFSADLPSGVLRDVSGTVAGAIGQTEVRTAGPVLLPDVSMAPGATRGLQLDAQGDQAPLGGTLTFDEDGLSGTLTNNLGVEIGSAVLYADGRTFLAGSLAARQQTAISVDEGDLLQRIVIDRPQVADRGEPTVTGEFTGALTHGPIDRLRNELVSQLMTVPDTGVRLQSRPLLIGYAPYTPAHPLGGKLEGRGWTVVAWPIELRRPAPGSKVLIPAGFTRVDLDSLGTGTWDTVKHEFGVTPRDGKLLLSIRPPDPLEMPSGAVARLRVDIRAMNNRMIVSGLTPRWQRRGRGRDSRGGEVPLETFDNPTGMVEVTVPDLRRFLTPEGEARLLITVRRTGQTGESLLEAGTVPKWWFRSVDVSLEGTTRE
ncbi:MAG: hypothetical protein ACLFV7_09970 [Phycisphaerae bacterium]